MKIKNIKVGLVVALAALGMFAASVLAHTGASVFACTGVTFSYTSFPTGSNTVSEKVTEGNTTLYSQSFTFSGVSATHAVTLNLSGDHFVRATSTWTADGGGSFDSGTVHIVCSTTTVTTTTPGSTVTMTTPATTVTVTTPAVTTTLPAVTVTTPAVTVTTPAQTVTNPSSTVTTPAVTVTSPAPPAVTTTKTSTVTVPVFKTKTVTKTKTKVVYRDRWHLKTIIKKVCPKPSPKQLCVSKGGKWFGNGCGFAGTG